MFIKIKVFLKKIFTTNLLWKLLSLFFAIVLWFIVININNPIEIKTFSVNLMLLNEDKLTENNLALLNMQTLQQTTVQIKIKGTRTALDEISKKTNEDKLKATIDLEQFNILYATDIKEEFQIPIKIITPELSHKNSTYEVLLYYPTTAFVKLDNIITSVKPLEVKQTGSLPTGYFAMDPVLSSNSIEVTGAKTIVNTIDKVFLNINLSNQTSSIEKKVVPVAYDNKQNEIQNIKFNVPEITVNIPIYKKRTLSILEPNLNGVLPDGYIIEDVSYYPTKLDFIGETNIISSYSSISLPSINISNLTKTEEIVFDITNLLKDEKIKLLNPDQKFVKVVVKIKTKDAQSFDISTNNLTILNNTNKYLIILPKTFNIEFLNTNDELKNLDTSKITGKIDIQNLDIGTHKVKVDLILPENITLKSDPFIEIIIKEPEKSSTTEETTTSQEETHLKDILP